MGVVDYTSRSPQQKSVQKDDDLGTPLDVMIMEKFTLKLQDALEY